MPPTLSINRCTIALLGWLLLLKWLLLLDWKRLRQLLLEPLLLLLGGLLSCLLLRRLWLHLLLWR